MTTTTVAVSKLVHSPRNVRQPSEDADTADLEATILSPIGLISPPVAHPMPRGRFGVMAGGRRLLALQRLIKRGDLPKDHAIDIIVRDEPDAILHEISIVENVQRVALPAVTEYEAFARLVDEEGATVEDVAHRYQITELHVRQRLRLGQLHPAIRAELAADRLSLDMAKAYGGTADQDLQKRVFDQRPGHPYEVRAAMKRDAANAGVDRMLALVGIDAYAAAGGRAEEDFFQPGESRILDFEVLRGAFNEKVAAERARLGIPTQATLQFDFGGVGARIEQPAELDDAARLRLGKIDGLIEEAERALEDLADWDDDGPIGRYVANAGGDQSEVDRHAAELSRLRDEAEDLHRAAAGTIDGPVIAVVDGVNLQLFLRGLHRPLGWSDALPPVNGPAPQITESVARGAVAAIPVVQAAATGIAAAMGAAPSAERPVINGFRTDRLGYSGVYRQPEEVAKEQHGLTKDAVEAMRSHQRRNLQAAFLGSPIGEKLAHTFLIFVLARDLHRERGADDHRVDSAGKLGVDRLPSIEHDPHQVRADLATQPAAEIVGDALTRLRAAEWMREPDVAAAFRRFSHSPYIEQQRAAAAVAAALLNRSLGVPGFEVPIHQVIAEFLSIDREVRSYWTPDEAFFARLSKSAKIEAIRFVDEAVAKRVANLGTDELTAAAALIMSGTLFAAERYGLTAEARRRADGWVPAYLAFDRDGGVDESVDDQAEEAA